MECKVTASPTPLGLRLRGGLIQHDPSAAAAASIMIVCCRRAASRWARAACIGPHGTARAYSTDFLQSLINWEQVGIPSNAGTAQSSAFDLGRMHRLLHKLGNPHLQLKAVHIAGSKGGQTEQSRMHIILVPLPSSHVSCVNESGERSSSQRACMCQQARAQRP